ncbi:MAG: ECF transporter S component [Clostridia bacterium]|nr:ECF transporter S component [Clostridia bacterium]
MLKKEFAKYPKVHPAMVAVWAALISVSGLLPTFPMFGTGGTFSIGMALAPLAGIMFGPWTGALAVAIGGIIGSFIAPHTAVFGIFTFISDTCLTFAAGFMARKNWKVGAIMLAIMAVIWFGAFQVGREAWIFACVIFGAGLIMCPIGAIVGGKLFDKGGVSRVIGLALIAWPCYMVGLMAGDILMLIMMDIPAELLNTMMVWLSPFERTVFAIASGIIGVPLLVGLPKISVYVGPDYDGEEKSDELDAQMAAEAAAKHAEE